MSAGQGLVHDVIALCDQALHLTPAGHPIAESIHEARARMAGPLRVAIAGRVKAGKSTLLNGLVGERLAPTDAGECTRIVSWYQQGPGYRVRAELRNGTSRDVRFRHDNGALNVEIEPLTIEEIDRLVVDWPSSNLRTMTLIDTPGLQSLSQQASLRTRDFLGLDTEDHATEADAVIYLMRHVHRHDADFLEAFADRSLANSSPVNAVAILSRADEIGAGRLDALDSASRIARRHAQDPRVRALCMTVLPVAGLLAETGATLQEHEAASLRELAALDSSELDDMLLSVDRFLDPSASPLLIETRRQLLQRFGLFGVRFVLEQLRQGKVRTATEMSRLLLDASGLPALRAILNGHFAARAQALKARTALATLRDCARQLAATDPTQAARMTAVTERFEAEAHVFAELRLMHRVLAGMLPISEEETEELTRLTSSGTPGERAGLAHEASPDQVRAIALWGIERWRTRAASPMIDRAAADAFQIAARSYEQLYVSVA
jgi:hypothetical protein